MSALRSKSSRPETKMSVKNCMHPRNPYRNRPNFKELALNYPEFRQFAKQKLCGKVELDFKDPAAVRSLTTVLLKKDFNLEVELPPNRLIPTLPLRLNYILWIEDILNSFMETQNVVLGVDIGTGACCIYPILGARKNKWHFLATETDTINYESSCRTVEKNCLSDFVVIKKVEPESIFIGNLDSSTMYTFSMCNPPFFDSDSDSPKTRSEKRHAPMCPQKGGSKSVNEIACKGGEVEFLKKYINESQIFKSNVRIFTTMLGHKSSVSPVIQMIENSGASSWAKTEFCQGRTTRWGVAWTYYDTPNLNQLPSPVTPDKPKEKPPLVYTVEAEKWKSQGEYSVRCIMAKILDHFKELKMEMKKEKDNENMSSMVFIAKHNTWTHQRRKRRKEARLSSETEITEEITEDLPSSKKRKVRFDNMETTEEMEELNLRARLFVRKTEASSIALQLDWISGGLGRESLNQILQFLKNRLFIDK